MSKRPRFRRKPDEGEKWGDFLKARAEDVLQVKKKHKAEKEKKRVDWEVHVKASRPISFDEIVEESIKKCKEAMLEQSGKGFSSIFYVIGGTLDVNDYVCTLFPDEVKMVAYRLHEHFSDKEKYGFRDVTLNRSTVCITWRLINDGLYK